MIRKVETTGLGSEQEQRRLIRRTWIPVEIAVQQIGEYRTFAEKLPQRAQKVVGAVITYDAPGHRMDHPRIFVGTGPNNRYEAKFLCSLKDDLVQSGKTKYELVVKSGQYFYYAQPAFLPSPELRANGSDNVWAEARSVVIRDQWTDFKLDYWVWKNRYPILGSVHLEVTLDGKLPSDEEDQP